MVTNSLPARHNTGPTSWQQELATAYTDPAALLQALGLDPALLPDGGLEALRKSAALFPLRVPASFVRRMRYGDFNDPLLRQVLPLGQEQLQQAGFSADPLEEAGARLAPGLLQKYPGRALLVTTGACAVHCRYCFRREYDYGADTDGEQGGRWEGALTALAADPGIEELILSGGDPLALGNARLASLVQRAAQMPQLKRLRLHTRTPIVLPSRVDAGLLALLAACPLQVIVVVHANHAAEIDAEVTASLKALRATGAHLLNQSVLLAGVNDDATALTELSQVLFAADTLPYYLFLLDRVNGTGHFEVPEAKAQALMRDVTGRLPGYLVPRLVREIPGMPAKTPVSIGVAVP